MRIVTIKLPEELDQTLREIAKRRQLSRSAVVREALTEYAQSPRRSVKSSAGELVGSLRGPRDLSTSKRHLEGYGE